MKKKNVSVLVQKEVEIITKTSEVNAGDVLQAYGELDVITYYVVKYRDDECILCKGYDNSNGFSPDDSWLEIFRGDSLKDDHLCKVDQDKLLVELL